jgi:Entner-Doudoroff aldolase
MSRLTTPAADAVAAIEQARSIVVLRLQDHAKTVRMGQILAEEGLRVMEVTLDHPDSVAALRQLDKALGGDVLLGAGTVRSAEQVRIAADAGARFCVSPHTDPAVVAAAIKAGLASIPGACTATEVATAVDAGAHFVKLFPAAPLGPGYLSALRGPFRDVKFVPTGGIPHNQLQPWYDAGAVAVGLGSDLIVDEDLDELLRRAAVAASQARRGGVS